MNHVTAEVLRHHLPARILSFGYPDNIDRVDMNRSLLVSVDLFPHRGTERILNIGEPFSIDLIEAFDIVLDCGTTEHCSNPAQAFINAASAVCVGGRVLHHLPISKVNHGYWNVCPSFLWDFYTTNGFLIERFDLTQDAPVAEYDNHATLPWPSSLHDPITVPLECLVLLVARRMAIRQIRLPVCEQKWRPA